MPEGLAVLVVVCHLGGVAFDAKFGQQLGVGFYVGVAGYQQFVAIKDGVGTGHEAQGLHGFAHLLAACGQAHTGFGHGDAGHSNDADKVKGVDGVRVGQGGAGHAHQAVYGHGFWIGVEVGQLGNEASAVHGGFAHAHNAAAAHANAGAAHVLQSVQAVLVGAGADDVGVVLGRGVEVVVVVVKPGLFKGYRLVRFEHAQGGAGLHAQAFDGADEFAHFFNVAVFGGTPCGAHAKAGGASVFGGLGGLQYFIYRHEFFGFDAGIKLGRLGAVAAVFGAAAGFNGQQRGQLDVACGPVLAVHGLGLVNQVEQGFLQQCVDGLYRPGASRGGGGRFGGAVQCDGRCLGGLHGGKSSKFESGANRARGRVARG